MKCSSKLTDFGIRRQTTNKIEDPSKLNEIVPSCKVADYLSDHNESQIFISRINNKNQILQNIPQNESSKLTDSKKSEPDNEITSFLNDFANFNNLENINNKLDGFRDIDMLQQHKLDQLYRLRSNSDINHKAIVATFKVETNDSPFQVAKIKEEIKKDKEKKISEF